MAIVPITDAAIELAQRERFLEVTRQQRTDAARALIRECYSHLVTVLRPYTTFEGQRRYRKVVERRYSS